MNKSQGFTGKALLGIIVAVVIITFILIIPSVNKIPALDEQVSASWSQVLNQYQRRSDLVPNLVSTVKGFANQEKEVLTAVVEARAKVSQMTLPKDVLSNPQAFQQFQEKQSALSSSLSRLLLVVERYPELKSDQNFLALQSQLEGTENRIAVARRDYIESVKQFNISIRTIPGVWIRGLFFPELTMKQNFNVEEETKAVPKVNFEK